MKEAVLIIITQIISSLCIVTKFDIFSDTYFVDECINRLTKDAHAYFRSQFPYAPQFLLTFVPVNNPDTLSYNIQEQLLEKIHDQRNWVIQVIKNTIQDFESYSDNCKQLPSNPLNLRKFRQKKDCKRHNVLNYKTQLYILLVEKEAEFNDKLKNLMNDSYFNSEAQFLIYVTNFGLDNRDISKYILLKLYHKRIVKTLIVISKNSTIVELYRMYVRNSSKRPCFTKLEVVKIQQCVNGKMEGQSERIFERVSIKRYNNCKVTVAALPYEPFVKNENCGFEVDIINEIGGALNISFDIRVKDSDAFDLGEKNADGTWTGFVEPIYNDGQLGIGNIAPHVTYLKDFLYSVGYYSEKIVWVVPIAALIPRWRVLTVIFSTQMWMICVMVIFTFGFLFHISKNKFEVKKLATFEKCLLAAFEVVIAIPLYKHPVGHITRIFFISLAVFAIIMNSVYTSSLVYYLQKPIREHQISSNLEIIKSDLSIGGSLKYKEMFDNSDPTNDLSEIILEKFHTVNNTLDTYIYWLEQVGNNRNIATITIKLCAIYLLSKNHPIVTDSNGFPKIYVLPQQIISQNVGIMMRKGHFLRDDLNIMIQRLIIESGIGDMFRRQYLGLGQSDDEQSKTISGKNRRNESGGDGGKSSKLTTHHLEGAFAILGFGYVSGIIAFVLEGAIYNLRKKKTYNIKKD